MTADVVVIGGGVMGSSIALHLLTSGVRRVCVVERDATYVRASSHLAFGGVRQLYGTRVNVELARRSLAFFRQFDELVSSAGHAARVGFEQHGWVYLVGAADAERIERRVAFQHSCGAAVQRLSVADVTARLPGLAGADIAFGVLGPEDGSLNPRAVLQGFRVLAVDAGATFLNAEVIGVRVDGGRVAGIGLSTGDYVAAHHIVCAAGAYSGAVGALADVSVPVAPVRQQLFRVALPAGEVAPQPAVVTPPGVYWRYERQASATDTPHMICGWTDVDAPVGEQFDVAASRWSEVVKPVVARYMPTYAGGSLVSSWAGLYEMTADRHPLLGEHPAVRGFYLACGFSGHGLMLSPAVGEALASLIVSGRSVIDVSMFAPDRFERGAALEPDDAL